VSHSLSLFLSICSPQLLVICYISCQCQSAIFLHCNIIRQEYLRVCVRRNSSCRGRRPGHPRCWCRYPSHWRLQVCDSNTTTAATTTTTTTITITTNNNNNIKQQQQQTTNNDASILHPAPPGTVYLRSTSLLSQRCRPQTGFGRAQGR